MSIPVIKHCFKKFNNVNPDVEELLYCLRRKGGAARLLTEVDVAKEVEEATSLTKSDLVHVFGIFFSELRKILVRGDRVKITDIGTFHMTISSDSAESPDDLSVRSINKVNIRFLPDKALKLVNNAVAPTRSDNNVSFAIVDAEAATTAPTIPGGDDGDDEYIDPNA